jgi:hypothetical protein
MSGGSGHPAEKASRMPARRLILAALIAAPAGAALAHHGWSSFDTSRVLDQTGPVIRSAFANPHVTVVLARDGQELTIELAPVFRMEARGVKPEEIAPGRTVRVHAYQNASNARLFRAEWMEIEGRRVQLR